MGDPRATRLMQRSALLVVGYLLVACSFTTSEPHDIPAPNGAKEDDMMARLAQAATMPIEAYNPAAVIEAVNALQPLGKEAALAEVERYLQQQDKGAQATGLFWVLRVLFAVPSESGFPPLHLGQPAIPPPSEAGHLPRFPIVMVQDVPLLASRGYFLAGLPEPVEAHIAYYRLHGTLRAAPLAPPATAEGLEEQFLPTWQAAYGEEYAQEVRTLVREQLARLYR